MKKLWIVKKEVWADTPEKAMHSKGTVYEVAMADEKYQPEEVNKKRIPGFKAAK